MEIIIFFQLWRDIIVKDPSTVCVHNFIRRKALSRTLKLNQIKVAGASVYAASCNILHSGE